MTKKRPDNLFRTQIVIRLKPISSGRQERSPQIQDLPVLESQKLEVEIQKTKLVIASSVESERAQPCQ